MFTYNLYGKVYKRKFRYIHSADCIGEEIFGRSDSWELFDTIFSDTIIEPKRLVNFGKIGTIYVESVIKTLDPSVFDLRIEHILREEDDEISLRIAQQSLDSYRKIREQLEQDAHGPFPDVKPDQNPKFNIKSIFYAIEKFIKKINS